MRPDILKFLAKKSGLSTFDVKPSTDDQGPSADYYGETATDFGNSQYDEQTSTAILTKENELDYLRGEKQSNWDKAGNGLVGMVGKAFTTATEGIINPFYGSIAALTHTDKNGKWDPSLNSYYNNDLTKALDNLNAAVEETNPFYQTKEEATDQGLAKLWHANTIFRDILSGAGTTIGAAITGKAWSKTFSALGKVLGAAQTPAEAAAAIESIKAGAVEGVKDIANASTKKLIKDGAKQGTIALMSATGEAGAEARESEKTIRYNLTHDMFGNEKQLTQAELEYIDIIAKQAGDMAFGMNLPVIMADNWLTFGKVMFGNKADDVAKIIDKGSFYDDAAKVYKEVAKGKYDKALYRAGKFGTPMLSEGNQEMLQFAIGKTAEDYYVKKYYNPDAADFLDSFAKGMAEAYTTQEGYHSGIIGALSAGITSPAITLATQGRKGFKDEYITNPEDAIVSKGVEMLNQYKVEDLRKKYVDNLIRSANLIKEKEGALENNDQFNYHNANEDLIFSYVYNRLQNGKLSETKKELENFKDLTIEELENSYGIKIDAENKTAIEGITRPNSVREFVEGKLNKIAKIEKTYNQVTTLFPGANPAVKELLVYSAQGIDNVKERKNSLTKEVAEMLPKEYSLEDVAKINNDPNAVLKSLSFNPAQFGIAYNNLTPSKKELFKKQVQESEDINPLNKQEIVKKLEDLESLKEREKDFTLTYNALKNPENAAKFLAASKELTLKFAEIASREKFGSSEEEASEEQDNESNEESGEQEQEPEIKPYVIPKTDWYDDTTSEEDLTTKLQDAVKTGQLSQFQAGNIFSEWIGENSKKQAQDELKQEQIKTQASQAVPKDPTKRSQSVLRTETKNRDSVFTTFQGKTMTLGEVRSLAGLISFSEIQSLISEMLDSGVDVNKRVKFTVVPGTDGSRVVLNLVDNQGLYHAVSIIEKYGLGEKADPAKKQRFQEVIDMFYNEDGTPKDVKEINDLHEQGAIQVDVISMLNYTIGNVDANGDFIDPMMTFNTLERLLVENNTPNFLIKDGHRELNEASEGEFTAFEEENSSITDGFHMVVEGLNQPIKLRLAPHRDAKGLIEELSFELQDLLTSNASQEDINAVLEKFNEQIFFALKPKENTIIGLRLAYDPAPNRGLYFRKSVLSKKDPNGERNYPYILDKAKVAEINNKYTEAEDRSKALSDLAKAEGSMLTNIDPSDLSLEYIIDQINASNLTLGTRPFKESDIKYNSPFTEEKELDTTRFVAPIGEEGLMKHQLEITAHAPVQSPVAKPAKTSKSKKTNTSVDPKADIEKRRQEELSKYEGRRANAFVKYNPEGSNTELTQDEIDEIELIINKATEKGWNVDRLQTTLANRGYVHSIGNSVTALRNFLQARLNGEINYQVNGNFLNEINAEYDAELAALETSTKPAATKKAPAKKTTKTKTTKAKEDLKPEDPNNPLNQTRGAREDEEEVFSIGDEESTGISEEEIEAIKDILPKFISIADIETILNNLKVNGIPYGVFKSNVIYLNTAKGKPGTAYHEAFHAVFRTVLTDEQIEVYYNLAAQEFVKAGLDMQKAIDDLLLRVPVYINKSHDEMVELVLEEYMADKFAEHAQKPTEVMPTGVFAKLWFKIKQFFKNLNNLSDLDVLFDNILKGKFVNASSQESRFSGSTESVFKLLPRFTGGFFSAEQSRKFINTFASKLYKIKTGEIKSSQYFNTTEFNGIKTRTLKSDEEILDIILKERVDELTNKGLPYIKIAFKGNEAYTAALTKLNDERRLILDDEKVYDGQSSLDILKNAVLDKLSQFKFQEAEDDEAIEYKDKFSSQEAWLEGGHESLSRTIKSYIGFATTTEVDELTGEEREVAVDEVAVYNGLVRLLADTSKEKMIAKLYYATRSTDNPNVKAFYDQVIKDLGIVYDPESNTVVLPNNQNKINVYNAILTAFDKSNIQMINAFQKEVKGTPSKFGWMRANTKDTAKLTIDKWSNNLTALVSKGFGVKDLAKIEKQIDNIASKYYNTSKVKDMSDDVLILQQEFKKIGMSLTQSYIEFSLLKYKASYPNVNLDTKSFTKHQLNILNIHEEVVPIPWSLFEPTGGFSLSKSVNNNVLNLYKGKKVDSELTTIAENNAIFDETTANFSFINAEGERVYEIISKSDVISSVIKFNTTNFAESIVGKPVVKKGRIKRDDAGNIIFQKNTAFANSKDQAESRNFEFLKSNWLLNRYFQLFNKGNKAGIKLNMLSGFVDTTMSEGKTKGGITFGKFDQRSYLLSALGLFDNNENKTSARYLFRQNEASGTAYVVELPRINVFGKNFNTVAEFFINQFSNEYNRIKREAKDFNENGPGKLKGYNTKITDKAFDFTEFKYLQDLLSTNESEANTLYNAIRTAAIEGKELSEEHLNQVLSAIGITSTEGQEKGKPITIYNPTGHGMLGIGFNQFKKQCTKNRISDFLPSKLKEDLDNFLYEFYINDYMMSSSFNELLDGDYALSRKDKDDISKRNKGGIASGNSYGKGKHVSSIIKAVKQKLTVKTINGKLLTITNESVSEEDGKYFATIKGEKYELAEYKPNDAMSYSSQYHIIMGTLRQGRLDEKTREIYKDIIQFTRRDENGNIVKKVNINDKNIPGYNNHNIQHLFDALASFNSKKTVVFDGIKGQYLKMSELGMVRSSISYIEDKDVDQFVKLTDEVSEYIFKDDFESEGYRNTVKALSKLYKPVPGMEYWHNLAQQMDTHGIDHVATEDASKGATLEPQDSRSSDFDLSKSKFEVSNESKRNQVETPTGKTEVTIGSQILGIITSEQKDDDDIIFQGEKIKIRKLKQIYYNSINNTRDIAFKQALRVIKDIRGKIVEYGKNNPGTIDLTELNEYVKRAVINSGADPAMTEFFDTPFNYNMVQKLVKAEQVVLAHFSKGVLAQKTNGDKVSLVSGVGVHLVKEIATGRIISHHEVIKNPSKYADKSKYSNDTKLRYNVKDPVTGEVYSECILSQQILTRHGLKIGDTITSDMIEVMKSIGYRIPTGDKQSAISLKVVSLLPDYYNGSGVFPDELVYLSGADFDIDSEFIQMPYFWYKKSDPTKPIKYGTETSPEDKWEAYKFYNLNYNKDFKRIYKDGVKQFKLTNEAYLKLSTQYENLNNHIDSLKKQKIKVPQNLFAERDKLKDKLQNFEHFIYESTSAQLGFPQTQEEYIKAGSPNTSAVSNNIALDAMISLLTNENMVTIANGTTSTQELSDVRDRLLESGLIKTNESKIKSKNRTVHDINGKFGDNVKNSEGAQGIGPVANKIQQFAFLMSKIVNGDRKILFDEDAFKFKLADFQGGIYQAENQDGKRIADELNKLLNMFTDNAKDPIAGTLNIKFELLGGMTEMIMQGMSFENAVKIINVPIIQEYAELIKTLNYGKKNKIEESFTKFGSQKEAIQRVIYGEKDEAGNYIKKFKNEDLVDLKKDRNPVNVSVSEIEDILRGNPNKGLQIEIFMQFLKIVEQGDLMSDINKLLKLNQGLNISFSELHNDVHKAIDNFDIAGLVGTSKTGLGSVEKPHIDIKPILSQDTNTLENIRRALFVDKQVGQKIFIEQTQLFKNELTKIGSSLSKSFFNKTDEFQKISKAFLGQISSLGYKAWLNDLLDNKDTSEANKKAIQQRLNSLNFGLLFSALNDENQLTLAKQLEVLQSHDTTRNNYFVRYVSSRIHDLTNNENGKINYKFDYIESRSFAKESDATMSLLMDSVKELYTSKRAILDETTGLTAKQFVDNMFNYLMVKDNMQFRNNSLSKFVPVGMFGQYSKMLDSMVESFVTNNEFSKNFDLAEIAYNFRKIFVTDVNTPFGAVKYKELKGEYQPEYLTHDGQIHIKIKGKGDDFKNNFSRAVDVFGLETVTVPDKLGKPVLNIEFPQFMKIKIDGIVKIYELQTARNSDKLAGSVIGLEGTYKAIEETGTKGVSMYFAGTYDQALSLTKQINAEEEALKEQAKKDSVETSTINEEDSTNNVSVVKVISGAQTGVDSIGLEIAKKLGYETGGTAPSGFLQEGTKKDPSLAIKYGVKEIDPKTQADYSKRTGKTDSYTARTEQNVINSDGTVYFSTSDDAMGKYATKREANKQNKPFIENPTSVELKNWLVANNIKVLNVAGNRGSKLTPEKEVEIKKILTEALTKKVINEEILETPKKAVSLKEKVKKVEVIEEEPNAVEDENEQPELSEEEEYRLFEEAEKKALEESKKSKKSKKTKKSENGNSPLNEKC